MSRLSSSDIILDEVEFVARLVMHWHQLLNRIIFLLELRDLLPLVESQHASIEQLIVLLDQTLLSLIEMTIIKPTRKVCPNGRQSLIPTDIIPSIEQHPRFVQTRTVFTTESLLPLLLDGLLD